VTTLEKIEYFRRLCDGIRANGGDKVPVEIDTLLMFLDAAEVLVVKPVVVKDENQMDLEDFLGQLRDVG
jgi:hypothetical protein